jgi:hypothetical protein
MTLFESRQMLLLVLVALNWFKGSMVDTQLAPIRARMDTLPDSEMVSFGF